MESPGWGDSKVGEGWGRLNGWMGGGRLQLPVVDGDTGRIRPTLLDQSRHPASGSRSAATSARSAAD